LAKTALLIEMIDLLRGRHGITVDELASSLGRSERTIYRWLNELSSDIGAPVQCKEGGYYLSEEHASDSLRLAAEELLALRTALKSLPIGDSSSLRGRAESAWLKIKDASSDTDLDLSRELSNGYDVSVTAPKGFIKPHIPQVIENAIARHHQLNIVYRSQKSNAVKEYSVDPYALVFRRHSWYVLAHCHEHGRVVQFRLVRFRDATNTGVEFKPPDGFSVDEYFKLSWEAWAGGVPTDVRVRFSPRVSVMVAETRRHATQRIHPQLDGGVIFEATVAGIEEIAIWVMGFGKEAEVLAPMELRDLVRDHALGMAASYCESGTLGEEIRPSAVAVSQIAPAPSDSPAKAQ
jgi:predicted DNA-binding transcriptional regulator YafY